MIPARAIWSLDEAQKWYQGCPWICGVNYLPRTAINSTEMWQADTFDLATIAQEFDWAKDIGLNSCRVFLPSLVWEADSDGLLSRMDRFLDVADRYGLSVMPVLFDDCAFAGKQPYLGPQDAPVPGVHNSGWTPSPGHNRVADRSAWPGLRDYVTAMQGRFGDDRRIIAWDLYNEPGNGGSEEASLRLLQEVFLWARDVGPCQPLTAATWNPTLKALNEASVHLSDVISFHHYDGAESLTADIAMLQGMERPLLCTEWMRRGPGASLLETHLPILRRANVGCYFWGLVQGRTQTYFPWGSPAGAPEPAIWFHDLLRADGSAYREAEVAALRLQTASGHSFSR